MNPIFPKSPHQPADQLEASLPSSLRKVSSKITANGSPPAVSQTFGHTHQSSSSNQRPSALCPRWTSRMFQGLGVIPFCALGNNHLPTRKLACGGHRRRRRRRSHPNHTTVWLGLRGHRSLEGHQVMGTSDPKGPTSILLEE